MSHEYLILDQDRTFKQDAWPEQKDAKGRVMKPARPARDEVEVSVRVDRQYRGVFRFPRTNVAPGNRQAAIEDATKWYGLGEEIAPGVQIVEVEWRFNEAHPAMVTPEEKDEAGKVARPEQFSPAQAERTEWAFTLRVSGIHLVKTSMNEQEMAKAGWKQALAAKVPQMEMFTR